MNISPDRLKELQNLPDSEINTSEIPELDQEKREQGTGNSGDNRCFQLI